MAEVMNLNGLKCPQPILKVAIKARTLPAGTTLEVLADCSTFPTDVQKWCSDTGKVLMSSVDLGGGKFKVTIQL